MSDSTASTPSDLTGLLPIEVVARLQHLDGLVFFDSAGNFPHSVSQAVTIIAAMPTQLLRGNLSNENDRARLRRALQDQQQPCMDRGFPWGGLCGWIEYDGSYLFGEYPQMLVYCHHQQAWHERGTLSQMMRAPAPVSPCDISAFTAMMSRDEFLQKVASIQRWIAAGDIYQVNLTQQFVASCQGESHLFELYRALRDRSPAPMAGWMNLGGKELLSSSPETFLKISGSMVETRPIKGTRPRFADPDEDRRSAFELQSSPKEIAELVMITDLLRNDLGQVCDFGSVRVDEMLQLETLEQVFHLVSTVRGQLRADADVVSALHACFPGGSITGAPKKRAMEIIADLETVPRGLYCGAMGYLGYNGECQMNIVIRTLVREGETLHYHVGAGIVADSDAENEYQETLQKAQGITLAVQQWQTERAQKCGEMRGFVQKELNKVGS